MKLLTYLKLTLTIDMHSSTVAEMFFNVICRPFVVSKYSMTKVPQESHIGQWWGGFIIQKCAANTKTSGKGITDTNRCSIHFGWKSEDWAPDLSLNELTMLKSVLHNLGARMWSSAGHCNPPTIQSTSHHFLGLGNGDEEQMWILSYVSHFAEWKATNLGGIPCTQNSQHRREKVNNCLYLFMWVRLRLNLPAVQGKENGINMYFSTWNVIKNMITTN